MVKKNPLIAGLLNMLAPGLAYMYVENDRIRFIKMLFVGFAAYAAAIFGGKALQHTPGFPLPQGLCVGILLLIVCVPLFLTGQKFANRHNMVLDSAVSYNSRQLGSDDEQLAKNLHLLKSGLISKQEFDSRKDNILVEKKD